MQWEVEIIKFFQSSQTPFFDLFFWLFSFFASFVGAILLFVFFYFFSTKKFSLFYGICTSLNVGLNYILKIIINRPRPYEVDFDIINKAQALGRSFPSGHMMCFTTMVFFVLLFIFQKYKSKQVKIISLIFCTLLLVCVGISRMYFGQHYITDLVAGLCLAIIFCCIEWVVYKKFFRQDKN